MRHTDSYFVRLDVQPHADHGSSGAPYDGRAGLGANGPVKRRRRRRSSGRSILVALLIVGLGGWTYWASHQPGGVSGTIDHWISHVRGDVANVSADPDLATARQFYTGQYEASKSYPRMSESDLAAAGIGVGINIDWCGPQAVVIQGADGGGTTSYLLRSGKDLGPAKGKYDCPADLTHPTPWK